MASSQENKTRITEPQGHNPLNRRTLTSLVHQLQIIEIQLGKDDFDPPNADGLRATRRDLLDQVLTQLEPPLSSVKIRQTTSYPETADPPTSLARIMHELAVIKIQLGRPGVTQRRVAELEQRRQSLLKLSEPKIETTPTVRERLQSPPKAA